MEEIMKVFITGISGLLGSTMAKYLINNGHEVVAIPTSKLAYSHEVLATPTSKLTKHHQNIVFGRF